MFYFFKVILRYIHTLFCYTETHEVNDNVSLNTVEDLELTSKSEVDVNSEDEYISLPYLNEHDPYYDINVPTYTLN